MPQPNALAVNGDAIRRKRLLAGLSQTEMAEALRISRPYLSRIESGDRQRVSGPVFARIRELLGVPNQEILGGHPGADSKESE